MLLVIVAALIVILTAILSVIESAIICVDELRLTTILRKRPQHANDIKYVIRNKNAHLSSMVVLITLVSISGSSLIGAMAARQLDDLWLAIFTGVLTYCMLVFAKILPKLFAVERAEAILNRSARFVRINCMLLKPFLRLALIWVKLLNISPAPDPTKDELKSILKHFDKSGVIGREERKFAELALKMNQKTLLTLLGDEERMVWLRAEATIGEIQDFICKRPFKRYLVVNRGKVTGIVLYRHITRCLVNKEATKTIQDISRKAVYLSQDSTLLDAIRAFASERVSVALLSGKEPEQTRMITAKQVYRAVLESS